MITTSGLARITLFTLLATSACKSDERQHEHEPEQAPAPAPQSERQPEPQPEPGDVDAPSTLEPTTEIDDGRIYNAGEDPASVEPELLLTLDDHSTRRSGDVRWSANGRWLFVTNSGVLYVREFDAGVPSLRTVIQIEFEDEAMTLFELLGGGLVVAVGIRSSLGLWSVTPTNATRLSQVSSGFKTIRTIVVSPDGRSIAVLGEPSRSQLVAEGIKDDFDMSRGRVQIWRIDPAAAEPLIAGPQFVTEIPIADATFTADGRHLFVSTAAANTNPYLVLLAVGDRELGLLRDEEILVRISEMAAVVGGSRVLVRESLDGPQLWQFGDGDDGPTLTQIREWPTIGTGDRSIDASADGRWFAFKGYEIQLWPLAASSNTVSDPVVLDAGDTRVNELALHPHGPYLAMTGEALRLWRFNRAAAAEGLRRRPSLALAKWDAGPQPVGFRDAIWRSENELITVDFNRINQSWTVDDAGIQLAASNVDEKSLAGRSLREWRFDPDTHTLVGVDRQREILQGVPVLSELSEVSSASSKCVISWRVNSEGSRNQRYTADAWRRKGEKLVHTGKLADAEYPGTAALTADGTLVAVSSIVSGKEYDISLFRINPATCAPGEKLLSTDHDGLLNLALSSDGRWLFGTPRNVSGCTNLWRVDLDAPKLEHAGSLHAPGYRRCDEHPGPPLGHDGALAVLSPDGSLIASAGSDNKVALHRMDVGQSPPRLEFLELFEPVQFPKFSIEALVFSPSGRRLAAVGGELGAGRIWVFDLAG